MRVNERTAASPAAAGSGRNGIGSGRPGNFAVSRVEMGVVYFTPMRLAQRGAMRGDVSPKICSLERRHG